MWDVGSGDPMVAIHGWPGSSRDYRWLVEAMASRGRLICVDLPGFGGSEAGGRRSLPDRSTWIVALLEALAVDRPVVLIGHSMGGALAATTAARFPEVVRGLALVASAGPRPHRGIRGFPVRPRWISTALRIPGIPRLAAPRLRGAFAAGGLGRFPDRCLVETVHCAGRLSFSVLADDLRRVRAPTLIAWAEDDRVVEPAIADALDDLCPAGPRIRYPDGGHFLIRHRASDLAEALLAWTSTLGVGRGLSESARPPSADQTADS